MALKKGMYFLFCMLPFFARAGLRLNLKQTETQVLDKVPELAQIEAKQNALSQEAIADGQWTDPKLILGAANIPINSFSFTQENMTQIQVGLMQKLPKGDSLSIRSLQDHLEVSATKSQKVLMKLTILRSVRISWLNACYWQKVFNIYQQERKLFNHLLFVNIKLLENKFEISESGNFEGNNILVEKNLIPDEDKDNLDQIKNKLLNIRRKRVKPFFDDKSQTDLNAYMLQVLLKTSVYLDDEDLKNNTIETIEILNTKLHQKIIHCYENKEIETFLEDHVYYALLMITLYEVNAEKKALEKSIKIMNDTWELFFNKETQLFQKNIIKDNDLFASPLDLNDSNIPNGNSVYLLISNKLYSITNDKIWSERNEVLKKSFHQVLNSYYSQMFSFIKTLDICDNSLSFTFSGTSQSIKEIQLYLQKEYLGVATFVYQLNNDTKPSVIVCKNQTCSNKLTNINEAVEYLSKSY